MRIHIASLPRGAVAGWGFGCAAKQWDAELFSVLKSISWGSLAEHATDHIALKMVLLVSMCYLFWYYSFIISGISIRFSSSTSCMESIQAEDYCIMHGSRNNSSLLFLFR